MSWMKALADCFLQAGAQHPGEPLMLVSDIDGTIIDMRYLVLSVLQSYDEAHGSAFFTRLRPSDVTVLENKVDQLLERLAVPASERTAVVEWYLERRWQEDTILATHRAFPGVFPMMRWFQLQPNTSVGLLSGRPEKLRGVTLQSLNRLGRPHRVHFSNDLLIMNPGEWGDGIEEIKMAGLKRFQAQGYHVFAMIDNEPSVLKALAPVAEETGMLLLHANTIFESGPISIPLGTARGNDYGLTDLVRSEEALPPNVQLVWHGVNDEDNLRQFFAGCWIKAREGIFWLGKFAIDKMAKFFGVCYQPCLGLLLSFRGRAIIKIFKNIGDAHLSTFKNRGSRPLYHRLAIIRRITHANIVL